MEIIKSMKIAAKLGGNKQFFNCKCAFLKYRYAFL